MKSCLHRAEVKRTSRICEYLKLKVIFLWFFYDIFVIFQKKKKTIYKTTSEPNAIYICMYFLYFVYSLFESYEMFLILQFPIAAVNVLYFSMWILFSLIPCPLHLTQLSSSVSGLLVGRGGQPKCMIRSYLHWHCLVTLHIRDLKLVFFFFFSFYRSNKWALHMKCVSRLWM